MKTTTFSLALAAILLFAAIAPAAGPTDPPPTTTGAPTRIMTQSSYAGSSETTISGIVVGKDGKPLVDIAIKLYVGGLLTSEQLSSSDGSFEFTELIDYARDVTVDVWFLPNDPNLIMENVLLKESTAAVQHGLYSPCVKRVRLDTITDFVVRLVDQKTRLEQLKRSGCLG
jgi:hypothetical protein